LTGHPLCVAQRTGVVIGDAKRRHPCVERQSQRVEQFADVA
jgi:hypothetical protein